MSFYRKNTLIKRKDGRLAIGQKEKSYKTENYYGRVFVDGKKVSIS